MKYLYKLTKAKYQEGALAALDNARAHLKIACLSASADYQGIGASHLIMACEELCKAALLRMKALYPQTNIIDLKKYFHDHTAKHEKVWEIYVAISKLEAGGKEDTQKQQGVGGGSEEGKDTLNSVFGLLLLVLLLIIAYSSKSDRNENLETMRQRGFYVDLADDKNWKLPNQLITPKAFQEWASFVERIFATIETHLFAKVPSQEQFASLAQELGYLKKQVDPAPEADLLTQVEQ